MQEGQVYKVGSPEGGPSDVGSPPVPFGSFKPEPIPSVHLASKSSVARDINGKLSFSAIGT